MRLEHCTVPSSDMFRPPINRAMRALDRSFFKKRIPLAAAQVLNIREIAKCQTQLKSDLLNLDRLANVRTDPVTDSTRKVLLLRPEIKTDDPTTWGRELRDLVGQKTVVISPYDLELDYSYWTYHDIISAALPEEDQDEIPTGFAIVGHVAHLNLREQYLPYKFLIAEVLMDKNTIIRTVINKVDRVGTQDEYRTFQYELLAGDASMDVEVRELDCTFRFDYSKVYWNTRLNTEHKRLVNMFNPGEAMCDVMAGVGPFAVPAGKKQVFIWANDLNPKSYESLVEAISINKVGQFVKPFNKDGREFIRESARQLMEQDVSVDITPKVPRAPRSNSKLDLINKSQSSILRQPKTFSHYVMNLPATATTFLDAFIGLYQSQEKLFTPYTDTKLPMIHVYCFSSKGDQNEAEIRICKEISQRIKYEITPLDEELVIWDVRDVAPEKRMFCASFRLLPEVAFR